MKRRFRLPGSSKDAPAEVRREIALHLELRAEEFRAQGMSEDEARRAALEAFGDRRAIESEVATLRGDTLRVRRRRDWFDDLSQDLRFAFRTLRSLPASS